MTVTVALLLILFITQILRLGILGSSVKGKTSHTPSTPSLAEEASYLAFQMNDTIHGHERKSYVTNKQLWWRRNDNGLIEIPYYFDHVDKIISQDLFPKFVNYFAQHTCIRWVWKQNYHKMYVKVYSGNEDRCLAIVGAAFIENGLYLSAACVNNGRHSAVPHEMMHILGFIHEHQRRDRDCYITISNQALYYDQHNMGVYRMEPSDTSFPYDPHSVMQYPSFGTMTWKANPNIKLGPVNSYPSEMDLAKINYMYCNGPHWCNNHNCQAHKQRQYNCNW